MGSAPSTAGISATSGVVVIAGGAEFDDPSQETLNDSLDALTLNSTRRSENQLNPDSRSDSCEPEDDEGEDEMQDKEPDDPTVWLSTYAPDVPEIPAISWDYNVSSLTSWL